MNGLRHWLPAPVLSALLFGLWLLLARSASLGQCLLGLALALAVPLLTTRLRPARPRIRRPGLLLRFSLRIAADLLASNLVVARDVLRLRRRRPTPRFVVVPLELRDPLGLAALAFVTTIVPGTVWCELALDRGTLLLHVWDAPVESDFVLYFKARYEQPLRDIFE